MNTGDKSEWIRAVDLKITDARLWLRLEDGREISVPLTLYPSLLHATAVQRGRWEWIARGIGIHWIDLDYDLRVDGILHGKPEVFPAPPPELDAHRTPARARKHRSAAAPSASASRSRSRSAKTRTKSASALRRARKVRK